MTTSVGGNWTVNGLGGRVPKCENCKALPAAKCISGISDICRFYLCRVCCEDIVRVLRDLEGAA